MKITVRLADYHQTKDGNAIIGLLDHYARDPMGGESPLSEKVVNNLIPKLQKVSGAFSVLAFADNLPIGLANCFQGFSTFKCQPLINIHDLAVKSGFRGQGIGTKMLECIQHEAKERGCCKITLEVLEGNTTAQSVYKGFGFDGYELIPRMGKAMFWQKVI